MGITQAGYGQLRSDEQKREYILDRGVEQGNFPTVKLSSGLRVTHGAQYETEPCGKCGCEFVNVGTPKHWPVETIALTCAKCGSVVEYVDGLLMVTVKQAIRERAEQGSRSRNMGEMQRYEGEVASYGLMRELAGMGLDAGLSDQDIAEALGVTEDYVSVLKGTL